MNITIKLNMATGRTDEKPASDCPELDKFKRDHKDLLAKTKAQYDTLVELMGKAAELSNDPNAIAIDDQPAFLADLYRALLELEMSTSILMGLLSESDTLMANEDMLDDLVEACELSADFLSMSDKAFETVLFGEDDDAAGEDSFDDGDEDIDGPTAMVVIESDGDISEEALDALLQQEDVNTAMQALLDTMYSHLE